MKLKIIEEPARSKTKGSGKAYLIKLNNGQTVTLKELSKLINVPYGTMVSRFLKYPWDNPFILNKKMPMPKTKKQDFSKIGDLVHLSSKDRKAKNIYPMPTEYEKNLWK